MTEQKTVVITGASTGIGEACALYLDARGWRVFAGVRKTTDGETLRAKASERLTPVMLDVTNADHIAEVARTVQDEVGDNGLHGLVNNAGIAHGGPMEMVSLDELRTILEVNAVGAVAVTQALIPMLRQAQGCVVNMSSISGRVALPLVGPYAMSKYALEAFSDVLRREQRYWNVRVVLVEPGNIATPIWDKTERLMVDKRQAAPANMEAMYGATLDTVWQRITAQPGLPPERVAEVVHRALTLGNPRPRYLIGRDAKSIVRIAAWLPTWLADRVFTNAMMVKPKDK